MISDYLVIACGIATNLAAVVICLGDRAKPLSPRKLWRAICKDQGIDPLRLRMALNPPALPHGGGARWPRLTRGRVVSNGPQAATIRNARTATTKRRAHHWRLLSLRKTAPASA